MSCSFRVLESLPGQLTPYLVLPVRPTSGVPDGPPGQDPTVVLLHSCPSLARHCKCSKGLCPGNGERSTIPICWGRKEKSPLGPLSWSMASQRLRIYPQGEPQRTQLKHPHLRWHQCIIPGYLKCVVLSANHGTSVQTVESILRLKISGVLQLC